MRLHGDAFEIGRGLLAIHVQSYYVDDSDHSHASSGNDQFLVYAPATRKLSKGFSIEGHARFKDGICFSAQTVHFLVGDVSGDGLVDIGVLAEGVSVKRPRSAANEKGQIISDLLQSYTCP